MLLKPQKGLGHYYTLAGKRRTRKTMDNNDSVLVEFEHRALKNAKKRSKCRPKSVFFPFFFHQIFYFPPFSHC
jgi:hypothetical protein